VDEGKDGNQTREQQVEMKKMNKKKNKGIKNRDGKFELLFIKLCGIIIV